MSHRSQGQYNLDTWNLEAAAGTDVLDTSQPLKDKTKHGCKKPKK